MVKAARAQRARTRDLVVGIERRVSAHDAQRPDRVARDRRIRSAKREARRALRARASAEQATRVAEVAAGAAVRRLLDEGLSLADTAVLLDLSRSTTKRLGRLSIGTTGPGTSGSSTEPRDNSAVGDAGVHGDDSSTATSGATKEGNL